MKIRTEILNLIIENYKFQSYLEIGVANPATNFDKINVAFKESVDPVALNYYKCKYTYNVTSDEFFAKYAGDRKYDIIFIDGLHTEEQVYKDGCNAIDHLNEGGFIVLHDCNPLTERHIITNNGTVFRGFIKLKEELPDWSCFVIDEDEGCGIITKRKLLENKIFEVSELTWGTFSENRKALLQLTSFDDFLQSIK
jgi:hypothetical protein